MFMITSEQEHYIHWRGLDTDPPVDKILRYMLVRLRYRPTTVGEA
jgi:hypothetical protein